MQMLRGHIGDICMQSSAKFDRLKDLAKLSFSLSSMRSVEKPLGVAVTFRDGSEYSWDYIPSDMIDGGYEELAMPLQAKLLEAQCQDELTPAQEIETIVICGDFKANADPQNCLDDIAKNALASYPGFQAGQAVYLIDPQGETIGHFKL